MLDEAISIARRSGDHVSLSVVLSSSARIAIERRKLPLAEQRARESLALRAELGDWCGMLLCIESFASVAIENNEPERAVLMLAAMDPIIELSGASSPGVLLTEHERSCDATLLALGEEQIL